MKTHLTINTYFHIFCVSLLCLGFVIARSVGEMGPLAPLLISIGVFTMGFGVILELVMTAYILVSIGIQYVKVKFQR